MDTNNFTEAEEQIKKLEVKIQESDKGSFDFDIKRQEKLDRLNQNKEEAELISMEKQDIIEMRKKWSNWILWVIVGVVLVDAYVILGIGHGFLEFKNDKIVPFFIGESFLKVIGLAIIIVGFLFNKKSGVEKNVDK